MAASTSAGAGAGRAARPLAYCAALSPAGLDLAVDGPRDLVTREQLRRPAVVLLVLVPAVGLLDRVGRLRLEELGDVVEHEPLALGVLEDTAVAPHRLGHEDAAHRRR